MKNIYYAITARHKKIGNDFDAERFTITKNFIDMAYEFSSNYNIILIPICSTKGLDDIANMCSGVIITGSSQNIKPSYYGGIDKKEDKETYDEYIFSRKIIDVFFNKKKLILGICYGMQAINVYFGGTIKNVDGHNECYHYVSLEENELLKNNEVNYFYDFINNSPNKSSLYINSYHSQAIDIVSDKLEVIATSLNKTIEAVQGYGNVIGIQWHPEADFKENILSYYVFKKFFEDSLKYIKD